MAQWSYQLTDANYVPLGEILNASERALSLGLSKPATASFTVRFDNPLMPIISTDLGYIKIYRDQALKFLGPIIGVEEVADNNAQSVNVQAASMLWVLSKRLAGKSATGQAYALQDRAGIAKALIDAVNLEDETGVRTGTLTSTAAAASTYTAGPYKPVLDCINELGKTFDGFDWEAVPIEPTTTSRSTAKVADWHALPVLGQARPETYFEYGDDTRNNLVSYRVQTSRDSQANYVWHVPSDTAVAPKTANDSASITTWGRMEDVAQLDITDLTLRQRLVDEHVLVRKQPRIVISAKPHIDDGQQYIGRVPQFGVDYDIGDVVGIRARALNQVRLNTTVRVYGISVSLDENGTENIDLTLVDE